MSPSSPLTVWIGRLVAPLVLLLLAYAWMPTAGVSLPNERTRVYLAASLVDHHSLSIDTSIARWGMTFDLAQWGGRHFTDKAPGTSFLAAGVYGMARLFKPASAFSIEGLITLMRRTIMLPFGIVGFILFRRLGRRLGMEGPVVDLAAIAWIVGSAAAHASAAFFGHQIVSVCLLAALALLQELESRLGNEGGRTWHLALAIGFIAGFALFTEYQSAIPFGFLALYTLAGPSRKNPRTIAWLALGTLPGAVGLLLYNRFAFGGFFQLSYHHLVNPGLQQLHGRGIGGVALPRAQYAVGALLSWHRGLFATSPFFLLAVPGFIAVWRHGQRRLSLLLGGTFAYYMLFVCSTEIWYAGWGFGPRLIVPAMGFAALLVAAGLGTLRRAWLFGVGMGLCVWGILYFQVVNVVFPELPERFQNPLFDVAFPALAQGTLVPNLSIQYLGLSGWPSLLPAAVALAIVLGFVLRRTDNEKNTSLLSRFGVATVIVLLMLCLARFTGPRASVESSARHLGWMQKLLVEEKALWKQERSRR